MQEKFSKYTLSFVFILSIASISIISCSNFFDYEKANLIYKEGIQFNTGKLDSAVLLAQQENKNIFVFVHATWCGVCKKMEAKVLPLKSVGDIYNPNFINVAIDFDSEEGSALKKQFTIKGTPTFLYLNKDGKLLQQTNGFQKEEAFIASAKNIIPN
jgi:thioredoxin-related protein